MFQFMLGGTNLKRVTKYLPLQNHVAEVLKLQESQKLIKNKPVITPCNQTLPAKRHA